MSAESGAPCCPQCGQPLKRKGKGLADLWVCSNNQCRDPWVYDARGGRVGVRVEAAREAKDE